MADDTNASIPARGIPYDYSSSERNHYTVKPPVFSGDYTEFEWWKSKMYTYIIELNDELWDILEDGIEIAVSSVGMVTDRKTLTPA